LLTVVGVERKSFNHQAVLKEKYGHVLVLLESLHVALYRSDKLLLSDKVEFFYAFGQNFGVDFFGQVVSKRWPLEL
jgi:hypothetical protein